jgi:cytochrome c peroxidase
VNAADKILLLIVLAVLTLFAFQQPDAVDAAIRQNITTLQTTAATLEQTAQAYQTGRISIDSLQATVTRTRLHYKRVEFILAYYYPEYVEEYINGAPLLHLERYDTRPIVRNPEGLQTLDELIYAADAKEQSLQITTLAQRFHTRYKTLVAGFHDQPVTGADATLALRLQLVRIFTLGVTGFDTPGSGNALAEAAASLAALRQIAGTIFPDAQGAALQQQFTRAIQYVQRPVSFNDFDRLTFLKDHINPLYKGSLRLQETLFPEATKTSYISKYPQPWNPASDDLFAADFLDPYFYTELTRTEDSDALRALGKKLFYDPGISHTGTLSCASCHDPAKGFADAQPRSQSNVQGMTVQRNAPTLLNAVYADRYFYDLRAYTLEQQAEHVIFNPREFNTAHEEILRKLEQDAAYRVQFQKAFSSSGVTRERFAKALASYVLSLKSFNSPFDRYVRGEAALPDSAIRKGFNLFMGKANCGTCHFAPVFSGLSPPEFRKNESEILGVLQDPAARRKVLDPDNGRRDNQVFSEESWIFEKSFKTTTVRNVALTAPYFHNGAYQTLEEVIDFYNNGGGAGHGLDVKNQTLAADSLQLSVSEKAALITFLRALTDPGVYGAQ